MRTLLTGALLALALLAGCHSSPGTEAQGDTSAVKVYKLRGKIVSANPSTGEVTVNHEAIPGFMEAMTMPYKLKDPGILSQMHPGDTITADVMVFDSSDANVMLDHIVVIAQGKPDYKPKVLYHVPTPGDAVPDFKLRNQDGRVIHFDQFRGKALLITFIYTRCPMPNFCPLMTHNFAVIEKQLAADPSLYARTHLICISFDPERDTPAVLRAYGAHYIGSSGNAAFAHWDFAVPSKAVLPQLANFFDVGISSGSDGSITHSLSTTLIDARGKVAQFYPGNEWTPDQVVADVKKAAEKS